MRKMRKQLLCDLKRKTGYWKLKGEALSGELALQKTGTLVRLCDDDEIKVLISVCSYSVP